MTLVGLMEGKREVEKSGQYPVMEIDCARMQKESFFLHPEDACIEEKVS